MRFIEICLHSASSEAIWGQIFKHQFLVAPTQGAHAKYKYAHLGSYTCGQCPFLLKCDILRADVAKYLHIFCGSNSEINLAGNTAPIFTLLCRPFILFPLALEVFPMLFSVSGKSAHLLHANHTSFSNLFFKLLLIPFMLILLLSFSFQLKSELPLTGSFKCVYLFIALCVS